MKQVKTLFVTVMLINFFVGCASNQIENPGKKDVAEPEQVCLFDDWQYKGFGYELPVWVKDAIDGKLSNENVKVFVSSGINSDMSEQKNQEIISYENLEGYELTNSTWVRVAANGEYISVKIYKLLTQKK